MAGGAAAAGAYHVSRIIDCGRDMKGILLFGHGSRSPEWARPFHAIRAVIAARAPAVPVALGFLEAMQPSFDDGIAELVAAGVSDVDVVPIFLATGGHIARDLPQLADAAMVRHPGIRIRIAAPAGESARVVDAMADYALDPAAQKF